ncbi:protein of unknown function [Nitratireductor aquimarinus]
MAWVRLPSVFNRFNCALKACFRAAYLRLFCDPLAIKGLWGNAIGGSMTISMLGAPHGGSGNHAGSRASAVSATSRRRKHSSARHREWGRD